MDETSEIARKMVFIIIFPGENDFFLGLVFRVLLASSFSIGVSNHKVLSTCVRYYGTSM